MDTSLSSPQLPTKTSTDSSSTADSTKPQNYDFEDDLDVDFEMIDASIEKHNSLQNNENAMETS